MSEQGTRFTGRGAWWVQRASAVYMLGFALLLLAKFALYPVHNHAQWQHSVGRPGVSVALATFFAALLLHMWVGLRDVLFDYAKPPVLQRVLLAAVAAGLIATAGSVIWVLMSLPR